MFHIRVVGLGQPLAGDDGVGPAMIEALAARKVPGVDLLRLREASELVALMSGPEPMIIVDAVVGAGDAGTVHVLHAAELDTTPMSAVSSHGIGVAQAVRMGRALYPEATADVRFVAISITAPRAHGKGLSPEVAQAVPEAVGRVVELVAELSSSR